jgi:hypothetical protein
MRGCNTGLGWLALAMVLMVPTVGLAQTKSQPAETGKKAVRKDFDPGKPREFRSARFIVHADLSDVEAAELLARLEKMYDLIGAYWGKSLPNGQVVEMYVVKDINRWPQGSIPADGLAHILAGGGVTHTETLSARARTGERVHVAARTVCFAVADRGTPQHEAVHAFCGLTFGTTGPIWYSEGMAEMGQYWREKDHSVQLPSVVLEYLQSNTIKSLNAIVNNQERTGDTWQNYAWRWALCHLLANNPNYAAKFRPLGLDLLMDRQNSFEKTYGEMATEISFEYKQFIATLENGYLVDLTAIDWKKKFAVVRGATGPTSSIAANRGWQPTQAIVAADKTYAYSTKGKWSIEAKGASVTADGDDAGHGRLMGAILTKDASGELIFTEPFALGASGEFNPPADGKLFVRASDAWGRLADNKGRVTFNLKLKE